jgi:uncharacterized protein YbjT (DUF2867 family)
MISQFEQENSMIRHKQEETTLVLGGTGKTGRRVVEQLRARGLPVRVGSRSGDPPFDWQDQATWAPVLDGARQIYAAYYPDIAVPGAAEVVSSFADLAVRSGVPRLVLLSGRGEAEAELAEQAVRDTGAELTVLRATWFAQNFSEGAFADFVLAGEVTLPAGDTPEPFVDVDDIADVAVAALTEDGHVGEQYELTGPRLLTFEEAVEEISRATGSEIRYAPSSISEFESLLVEQEVPADFVWLLRYLFTEVLDGRNAHVADGVQRALGREPKDFADFARHAAAEGAWNVRASARSAAA